ncbi:hypothetical protein CR513_22827, partial [Mucuna pruriens]
MEGDICHHVRKLRPIPTKTPNVQSLRQWGSQLKGHWRRTFERKYDNLLGVLAPTLEEYERLWGIPLENLHLISSRDTTPLGPRWKGLAKMISAQHKKSQPR